MRRARVSCPTPTPLRAPALARAEFNGAIDFTFSRLEGRLLFPAILL